MSTSDAVAHLDSAIATLTLEAYRVGDAGHLDRVDHITIAEELRRVDCAIGPRGESLFARLADSISEAYVEILAARRALNPQI